MRSTLGSLGLLSLLALPAACGGSSTSENPDAGTVVADASTDPDGGGDEADASPETSDGAPAQADAGPSPTCVSSPDTNLSGVSIEFTGDDWVFTQAEAAAGISIPYRLVVNEAVADVVPQPQDAGGCGGPDGSGLILFERLAGGGQQYCLCDTGLCGGSNDPVTLTTGTFAHAFEWEGRNWGGPSDTGNPMGEPFPPGTYTLTISAIGTAPAPGGSVEFEVSAHCDLTITP